MMRCPAHLCEKRTIAELEIMLHGMSNMHEPLVVQGSVEADNQLVEMIREKLIAEQLPHSSDRPLPILTKQLMALA